MTKIIKQEIIFKGTPSEIYDALMDEEKHAEITGTGAKIEAKIKGKFSVWDGYASGEFLDLIPEKKIVETWRASDWPPGHYSTLTITLFPKDKSTILKLEQLQVPDDQYEDISQGWHDYYWKPLKKFLKK